MVSRSEIAPPKLEVPEKETAAVLALSAETHKKSNDYLSKMKRFYENKR